MVPRHVATCSGPARAAERALPCGHRVRVVHASLHGSGLSEVGGLDIELYFQALTWAWTVFVDCRLRQNTRCNEHHLVLYKSGVLHYSGKPRAQVDLFQLAP